VDGDEDECRTRGRRGGARNRERERARRKGIEFRRPDSPSRLLLSLLYPCWLAGSSAAKTCARLIFPTRHLRPQIIMLNFIEISSQSSEKWLRLLPFFSLPLLPPANSLSLSSAKPALPPNVATAIGVVAVAVFPANAPRRRRRRRRRTGKRSQSYAALSKSRERAGREREIVELCPRPACCCLMATATVHTGWKRRRRRRWPSRPLSARAGIHTFENRSEGRERGGVREREGDLSTKKCGGFAAKERISIHLIAHSLHTGKSEGSIQRTNVGGLLTRVSRRR